MSRCNYLDFLQERPDGTQIEKIDDKTKKELVFGAIAREKEFFQEIRVPGMEITEEEFYGWLDKTGERILADLGCETHQ